MLGEAELTRFRLDYYTLFARLLAGEPDAGLLQTLNDQGNARMEAAEKVHSLMGEGWREILARAEKTSLEDITDEFNALFILPSGDMLNPYESFYITHKLYDTPLVEVREFLNTVGLEKDDDALSEPEDALVFELEVMRWLVDKQLGTVGTKDEAQWLEHQQEFLSKHVLVWAPSCSKDIESSSKAGFYRGMALLLRGFLEVENDFFVEEGMSDVETLEEARKRYHAPAWKGPIYDPDTDLSPPSDSKDN